jgi:hypothetical protein
MMEVEVEMVVGGRQYWIMIVGEEKKREWMVASQMVVVEVVDEVMLMMSLSPWRDEGHSSEVL